MDGGCGHNGGNGVVTLVAVVAVVALVVLVLVLLMAVVIMIMVTVVMVMVLDNLAIETIVGVYAWIHAQNWENLKTNVCCWLLLLRGRWWGGAANTVIATVHGTIQPLDQGWSKGMIYINQSKFALSHDASEMPITGYLFASLIAPAIAAIFTTIVLVTLIIMYQPHH